MRTSLTTILFFFILSFASAQNGEKIVGVWKYQSVTTTNPNCKSVDYFPINTFKFKNDGTAEFHSAEGIAEAKYNVVDKRIELFDLYENGEKQEGEAQFLIKSLSEEALILTVEYECGMIDIVFKL